MRLEGRRERNIRIVGRGSNKCLTCEWGKGESYYLSDHGTIASGRDRLGWNEEAVAAAEG